MDSSNFRNEIRIDRANNNVGLAVLTNLFLTFLVYIIFSDNIALSLRTAVLLGLNVFISLMRLLYLWMVRSSHMDKFSMKAFVWFHLSILLSAVTWGFIFLHLYITVDSSRILVLLALLFGLATGGVINLSSRFSIAFVYFNLVLSPLFIYMAIIEDNFFFSHAQMMLVYYLFLTFWSYQLSREAGINLGLKVRHLNNREKFLLNEKRYRTIFEEAPTGIFYYNKDLIIQNCNASFVQILQADQDLLIGLDLNTIPDKRGLPAIKSPLNNEKGFYEGPYHTVHSDIDIWVSLKTTPLSGKNSELIGGVGIIEDLTVRNRIKQEIEYQAYHDSLTKLPNRKLMMDRLEQALHSAQRHGYLGALLFLDLDKFKLINDTLGHRTGDLLLVEVAGRLRKLLREEDTVARIGGDEFVILLPNLDENQEKALQFTNLVNSKIHDALSDSILVDGQSIQTSTSIGVYIFSEEDSSAGHILKAADTAMYNAKDLGRNRSSYFHAGMEEVIRQKMILEVELKEALKHNQLEIYFQPIVETGSERIVAAEALLRWNHAERGFICPEEIIEAAESSNQIIALGDWIVERVLAIYGEWLERGLVSLEYVSINISIKQILNSGFAAKMIRTVSESTVPMKNIVLEITESVLISDFERTVKAIRTLRKAGIRFALDDFGTGYSSLGYLKRLPMDKLKIDRSFTQSLLTSRDDFILVETILSIAEYFQLDVITEGVEEQAQVEKLKEMGCPLYQGYFCSMPLPEDKFLKLLKDRSL